MGRSKQLATIIESAPSTLDTLNELAAAIGDDANFSTTITNSIATKMPLAGGDFAGSVTGLNNVGTAHNNGAIFDSTGTTQLWLRDTDATSNQRNWGFQVSGGDLNIVRANDDRASGFVTPIYMQQAPSNSLVILSNGNVGIGTNNPGTKLHIDGDGSQPELRVAMNSTYYTDIGINHIDVNGPNDLRFLMGGADKVRFKSDGKVGIGTNTPTKLLHLYGDENSGGLGLVIQDDGWGAPNGMFMTTVRNSDGAYTIRKNTSNAMDFATYTDMLSVKGDGNVGIGTTSPDTKLHVAGTQNTPSGASKGMLLVRADGSTHGLQMGVTGSSPWGSWIQAQDNNISAPYPLILQPGGGKVGIGEDNPLVKLDMGLTSPNDQVIALRQNGVSRTTLGLTNNYGVRVAGPSDASATGAVFEVGQNNASDGTTYQNTALTVLYNGNVGIGTTSPVYELDVRGVFISPIGITSTHTGAHANQYPITNRTIINGRLNLSFSVYFQHNTSNLAVRLYCPVTSWWASGEVIIGSTYSYGNASGFRRYTFTHNQNSGTNYNHTLTNTENRGSTSSHFELNSHGWDATEGAHYWEFRHIASSGNNLYCQFQTFGSGSTVETVNWYYRHVTY